MRIVRLLCLFVLLVSLGGGAEAGVGPMITIWTDIIYNGDPVVAYSPPHDAFIVIWGSAQDSSTDDIWARVVTAAGALQATFNVDTEKGESMRYPAVVYGTAQDQYLVAYGGYFSGSSVIKARRIAWNGPSATTRIAVDDQWGKELGPPAVAYNGQDDEFLVVYH